MADSRILRSHGKLLSGLYGNDDCADLTKPDVSIPFLP